MSETILQYGCIGPANDVGTKTATSNGTTLTASASTNTKGAYAQLIASTAQAIDFIIIGITNFQSSGNLAIDIAIGGAGVEQVIIANLVFATSTVQASTYNCFIPFSIPSGTRIAARCQSTAANDKIDVSIICGSGANMHPFHSCDTYGFTTSPTGGTAVDPGGSANTKGSYAQITAATNKDHYGLMWICDDTPDSTGIGGSEQFLYDIAIGAGGSENVIIPNIRMASSSTGTGITLTPPVGFMPIQIPTGSRLSVRTQSTITTATVRKFGITLYGFS